MRYMAYPSDGIVFRVGPSFLYFRVPLESSPWGCRKSPSLQTESPGTTNTCSGSDLSTLMGLDGANSRDGCIGGLRLKDVDLPLYKIDLLEFETTSGFIWSGDLL